MGDDVVVRPGAGDNIIFDMWVEGKLRLVAVTREAIEDYLRLPPEAAANFSPQDRVQFVQNNLSVIIAAAKWKLRNGQSEGHVIMIRSENIKVGFTASAYS